MNLKHEFVYSISAAEHIQRLINLAQKSNPPVNLAVWITKTDKNKIEVESTFYGGETEDEGDEGDEESFPHDPEAADEDGGCGCNDCVRQRSDAQRADGAD